MSDREPASPGPVEETLERVIDLHRIRPNRGLCACGWEATGAVFPEPKIAPSRQYIQHVAAEQAKALRQAGLV